MFNTATAIAAAIIVACLAFGLDPLHVATLLLERVL